jgi:hypothetical protein
MESFSDLFVLQNASEFAVAPITKRRQWKKNDASSSFELGLVFNEVDPSLADVQQTLNLLHFA